MRIPAAQELRKVDNLEGVKAQLDALANQHDNLLSEIENQSTELNDVFKKIEEQIPDQELNRVLDRYVKVNNKISNQIKLMEDIKNNLKYTRAEMADKKVPVIEQEIANFSNGQYTDDMLEKLNNSIADVLDAKIEKANLQLTEGKINYNEYTNLAEKARYQEENLRASLQRVTDATRLAITNKVITDILAGKGVPIDIAPHLEVLPDFYNRFDGNIVAEDYASVLNPVLEDLAEAVVAREQGILDDIARKLGLPNKDGGYTRIKKVGDNTYQITPVSRPTHRGYLCIVGDKIVLMSVQTNLKSGNNQNSAITSAINTCQAQAA